MVAHPSQSPWAIPVAEMSARAGHSMHIDRIFPAPEGIGDMVIGVKPGADVKVCGDFDSVVDGLMFQGEITAPVHAECSRCLIGLRRDWPVNVCVFFPYAEPPKKGQQREDKSEEEAEVWDENDESGSVYPLVGGGDFADIEALIRDTFVEALPWQPLCDPDCLGLCSQCGENLNEHPDHHHEVIDSRFASLASLKEALSKE